MNLDKIQEMWERDAVIDPDNLHDESLKYLNYTQSIIQSIIQLHYCVKKQENNIVKSNLIDIITIPEKHLQRFMLKNLLVLRSEKRMQFKDIWMQTKNLVKWI